MDPWLDKFLNLVDLLEDAIPDNQPAWYQMREAVRRAQERAESLRRLAEEEEALQYQAAPSNSAADLR